MKARTPLPRLLVLLLALVPASCGGSVETPPLLRLSGGASPNPGGASTWGDVERVVLLASVAGGRRMRDDPCAEQTETSTYDVDNGHLRVVRCVRPLEGAPTRNIAYEGEVVAEARRRIESALLELREVPKPTTCIWDGPVQSLELVRGRERRTFLNEDVNCMHRSDVGYVSPSLLVLAAAFEAARPPAVAAPDGDDAKDAPSAPVGADAGR